MKTRPISIGSRVGRLLIEWPSYITIKVSENHFDLEGKYHGQRYLKSVVKLIAQTPFVVERGGSYSIQ